MHVRGARRTGRAAGVHGRRAGGVRRAGLAAGVRYERGARLCAGALERVATGALLTREHVLHPE
ncbi:hypothetical protein CDL15_Pgr014108 [Punica granatum]|uniref:Uncharacterized protein n=1 Tax=Punica granatum TaxID=22663 RepID=A0A218VVR7_PUNGR|nr:hypothetical protein CDL15_Pgr014108 [Punica granatum]